MPRVLLNGFELIRTQQPELVHLNVGQTLCLVLPAHLGLISQGLGQDDVIVSDTLLNQTVWIRCDLLVAGNRIRCGE